MNIDILIFVPETSPRRFPPRDLSLRSRPYSSLYIPRPDGFLSSPTPMKNRASRTSYLGDLCAEWHRRPPLSSRPERVAPVGSVDRKAREIVIEYIEYESYYASYFLILLYPRPGDHLPVGHIGPCRKGHSFPPCFSQSGKIKRCRFSRRIADDARRKTLERCSSFWQFNSF